MKDENQIKNIFHQQKILTDELEKEVSTVLKRDYISENDTLKTALADKDAKLDKLERDVLTLSKENKELKNSLYEQLYNEKIAILNLVNKKVDTYFISQTNSEFNRLKNFEIESKRRIDEIKESLIYYRINSEDEIFRHLNGLEQLRNEKIAEAREAIANKSRAYEEEKNREYGSLRNEKLSDEEMKGALKKNNIESLIGLNILNKVGILFLIVGVIALMQYTYLQVTDVFKGIMVFVIGTLLLICGELLNQKKANVFSLGLTSAGVAILYIALFISYFELNIITMYPALLLCIMVTGFSFFLSQRYNSQTIATFSLIGGYLPVLTISYNMSLVYSAMIYFMILNLLSLMISFRKKWSITTIIGFGLNVIATSYIMGLTMFSSLLKNKGIHGSEIITTIYIIFTFLIYSLIPIMGTYYNKEKLGRIDFVVILLNTYISAVFLYIAFTIMGLVDFDGLLTIIFAILYACFGKLVEYKLPEEKRVKVLFYLTSFAFAVLIVPLQLGVVWLSLGWLVEGVILIVYGVFRDEKVFRKYGFIAAGLSLFSFILIDIPNDIWTYGWLFAYKYFAITLASIIIIGAYSYKKKMYDRGILRLKYCSYLNVWFFMIYMVVAKLSRIIENSIYESNININYLIASLSIVLGFLIAYAVPKIKVLSDKGMDVIAMIIYSISIFWLLILNMISSPVVGDGGNMGVFIVGTAVLVIINILSILAFMDFIKYITLKIKQGIEWYPLFVSMYFVLILTQNLIMQYDLKNSNFIISVIYMILAFSWIAFGFIRRYSYMRRFGLVLSFMAIVKLFIIDLSFLTKGYKIISYFIFGVSLLAISFVYQYYNKQIE